MAEKIKFPDKIQEKIELFLEATKQSGLFENEYEIPKGYSQVAQTHLWNMVGEMLISKFISGDDYTLTESQATEVITHTILQTNLDSLMDSGLIDGIENENGEMVYFTTNKGKDTLKDMGEIIGDDLDC
jgi:predicted transcriptional regulator